MLEYRSLKKHVKNVFFFFYNTSLRVYRRFRIVLLSYNCSSSLVHESWARCKRDDVSSLLASRVVDRHVSARPKSKKKRSGRVWASIRRRLLRPLPRRRSDTNNNDNNYDNNDNPTYCLRDPPRQVDTVLGGRRWEFSSFPALITTIAQVKRAPAGNDDDDDDTTTVRHAVTRTRI